MGTNQLDYPAVVKAGFSEGDFTGATEKALNRDKKGAAEALVSVVVGGTTGHPLAGVAAGRLANAITTLLSDPNTQRFLQAGADIETERANAAAFQQRLLQALAPLLRELAEQSQEQFEQTLRYAERNLASAEGQAQILEILRTLAPAPTSNGPALFEGPRKAPAIRVPQFSGRQDPMTELERLLTSEREQAVCVVAAGIGGIGKTALAQHFVATRAPELFPGGAAWLDATSLPGELARAAVRFGCRRNPEPTPEQAREYLTQTLAAEHVLLVLDNVPEEPSAEIYKLLPLLNGSSRTLLTSRCRSLHQHLPAPAKALDLDCWTPEASIEFLRELGPRCAGASDAELAALAAFVGRLPLGVRLLGMLYELRVTRGAAELLDELRQEPLRHLDQVAEGLERGLAQSFTAAFDSLDPHERRLLLALAAAAPATRDVILAEVSGLALRDTKNVLERLRDWSLAEFFPTSPAPWGLHDVVRLFVQVQVDYPRLVNAHRDWVKTHCQKYKDPEEHADFALSADEVATAVRRLVAENDSDAASSLHFPLYLHMKQVGRIADLVKLTIELLAIVPEGTATESLWLGNLGLCFQTLGDVQKAIGFLQRSLDIHTKLGSLEGQANQLGNLGGCYQTLGDIQKAIDFLQRSLNIHTKLGSLQGQGNQLGGLGLCYKTLGDIEKARGCFTRSVALFEQMGVTQDQENYAYFRHALKGLE